MKDLRIEIFSPAKINLFLAVMGERGDGFHELLSLVGQVKFGDTLRMELVKGEEDRIECDVDCVPVGGDNLIMRAIVEVRRRFSFSEGVRVKLEKRIPMGAGLGGGSSNGVAALKGLNSLLGGVLSKKEMKEIAMRLGSDCPIFLEEGVVVVRGRGEEVERVGVEVEEQIRGQRVMIFKPGFSINTGWAYGEMRKRPECYIKEEDGKKMLEEGLGKILQGGGLEGILYNNFEDVIFGEHLELREVRKILYKDFNVRGIMSGSGSACFLILKADSDVEGIKKRIEKVLGKGIFIVETVIG